MRSQRLTQPLSWLLFTTTACAQSIIDSLSFGQGTTISPDGRALPGWQVSDTNHKVQILSDRIILTPPIPGNARGALWTESTVESADWTAEIDFRASGQETGTGNFQLWFTKDRDTVGQNSVYTVDNFDGFALVLDQYGGTGGKLRGFLNDGTVNYKAHGNLESLAFGHCDYSYRNLGRPSKLRVTNQNGLSVTIDDRECFRTDRASLPPGYYFGITAATGENPDSFEVNRFAVSSSSSSTPQQQQQSNDNQPSSAPGTSPHLQKLDRFPGAPEAVPDRSADEIKSQSEQFADLHNRLQGMTHQVANMFSELETLSRTLGERHEQLIASIPRLPREDAMNEIMRRVEGIERTVQQVQRDVEGRDYGRHLDDLQRAVDHVKGGLTEGLPDRLGSCEFHSFPFIHSSRSDAVCCVEGRLADLSVVAQ